MNIDQLTGTMLVQRCDIIGGTLAKHATTDAKASLFLEPFLLYVQTLVIPSLAPAKFHVTK
jgi:hypothetical protein